MLRRALSVIIGEFRREAFLLERLEGTLPIIVYLRRRLVEEGQRIAA